MRRKCLTWSIRFRKYGRHFLSDVCMALPIALKTTDLMKGGTVSKRPTTCMIMLRWVPIVSYLNSNGTSSVALRDLVFYELHDCWHKHGMLRRAIYPIRAKAR